MLPIFKMLTKLYILIVFVFLSTVCFAQQQVEPQNNATIGVRHKGDQQLIGITKRKELDAEIKTTDSSPTSNSNEKQNAENNKVQNGGYVSTSCNPSFIENKKIERVGSNNSTFSAVTPSQNKPITKTVSEPPKIDPNRGTKAIQRTDNK